MDFYINKHPIKNMIPPKEGSNEFGDIPEGTSFTICGIMSNAFELKPTKNLGDIVVFVEPKILDIGFTKTEYIE